MIKMTPEQRENFWIDALARQMDSGLPADEWCRLNHVRFDRFCVWKKRLENEVETSAIQEPIFTPVKLRSNSSQITLTINDHVIICEKALLADIMELLK